MMKCVLKEAIVIMTCCLIQAGAFYVTSRPVAPQLKSLLELVTEDINYRYTDMAKRLTAIKDKDLSSCFVTNYDPQWNLYKTEKEDISRKKPFQTVKSTTDFVKLRRKAGNIIAHMCKRVKIFWLNQQQNGLLPPSLLPGNRGQNGLLPPPLPIDQGLLPPPQLIPGTGSNKQGGSPAIIPQPALPKQNIVPMGQNQNQAPPLISSTDAAQAPPPLISGGSGDEAPNIDTPPPLALWLQMQQEKTQPQAPPLISGQNGMVEPPQIPNNGIMVPPQIPMGDTKMENGQSRSQRNLKNDDLQAPPTLSSKESMLDPLLPDFRTPPSPFENHP